ncbi:MAG TPA: hypothetical protein VL068_08985 [Microthrixaceae bacterium]|nr:hypothetical protein [Microthrixaceae bacterium]
MKADPLQITGPDVLIPGSDILLAGIGRIFLAIGVVGVVVSVVVRLVRKRRLKNRPAETAPNGPFGVGAPAEGSAAGGGSIPGVGRAAEGSANCETTVWGVPDAAATPARLHRPVFIAGFGVITIFGLVLSLMFRPPPFEPPILPALPRLLPEKAFFYRTITDLPVVPQSDSWIGSQNSMPLTAAFGSEVHMGHAKGLPFNPVTSETRRIDVNLTQYKKNSFQGPFPIADPPYIETFPLYGGDQHYLAIDVDERRAWELISLRRWFTRWEAGAGASWSMDELSYPVGSTIAARLPLLPGVITYAEVEAGSIDHVILGSTPISAPGEFIWPARGSDGVSPDPAAPPMGAWLRLKANADLSQLGPQARIVARAAQTYGMMISDTGPGFKMRGTADRRWDSSDLKTLQTLTADDFEVVDSSDLMVSIDSMEVRPATKP